MPWKKLGHVFNAPGKPGWMTSHAMIPTADHREGDVYRIYFAPRDEQNRSNVGWLDLDLRRPTEVLAVSPEPVLTCGELGGFDDSGALASWIVNHEGTKYFYYIGYNVATTVIFRNYIGLATSTDGGRTFQKMFRAGVIDRTHVDPLLAVTPCVLKEGDRWRMWYTSGVRWDAQPEGKPKHYYHIKYAESSDGIKWNPEGHVAVDFKDDAEYAIARPSVLYQGGRYRMWFCCRGTKYRMGYAESADGLTWQRDDERAGLLTSASGWDGEMVAYPFVFEHAGRTYMLYNGNGYGQTGFGIAVLDE